MNRKLVGLAIIGAMLLIAPIGRAAEEKPDATVKMTGKALSAGVGYSWGSGVLTYQGKEYPFSISGISAGDIGFNVAELSGEVFNLKYLISRTLRTLTETRRVSRRGSQSLVAVAVRR